MHIKPARWEPLPWGSPADIDGDLIIIHEPGNPSYPRYYQNTLTKDVIQLTQNPYQWWRLHNA